jgi:glycosyltransferase involved in cell wall biosynthesis
VYLKQSNQGPSGARNAGIRAARGELVALLDADDLWDPEHLQVQVSMMAVDPTIDVLYGDAALFGDPLSQGTFMQLVPSEGDVTFEALVRGRCTVLTSSVVARRDTMLNTGLFDTSVIGSEDFDLWLRILKNGGRIAYHRRVLVRRRLHRGSLSTDNLLMYRAILRVLEKASTYELSPAEQLAVSDMQKRFRALSRHAEGKRAFFEGDVRGAITALSEANAVLRSRKISLAVLLLRLAPRLLLQTYDLRDRLVYRTCTRA